MEPTSGKTAAPANTKRYVIIGVIVAAALGYALYLRASFGGPANPSTNTNNANLTTGTPAASPSPIEAVPPLAEDERQTIGSTSVLAQAGQIVRENESLKGLFAESGLELVATRSIGNVMLEEITAKIKSNELTPQQAAEQYWRVDILEMGNTTSQGLDDWVAKYMPLPTEGPGLKLEKGTRNLGGKTATSYQLTNSSLGLVQTIFFIQPKASGNVVIVSTFQGEKLPFQEPIEALLKSVEFSA